MNENGYLRKFGGDKIALLGLFVVALISAYLIVSSKSSIILSEPIELPYTGLSVSVPHGNGWQSSRRWTFQNNTFTVGSSFALNNRKPSAWALCRYRLAAETIGPQELFKNRALEIDGQLVTTDHIENVAFTIDCAYISNTRLPINVFLGTIRLPHNHQLDIEIHENGGDIILAEETFIRMVERVSFEGNELMDIGSEIISSLKSEGVSGFLNNQKQQSIFLIEDAKRRTIGYELFVIGNAGTENQKDIKAVSMLYLRGSNAQEQITSLSCDDKFDEFIWKSESLGPDDRSSAELVLNSDGVLTVKKFGFVSLESRYNLSKVAMPDVLLDFFFFKMFERNDRQAQVDMIRGDGRITPTLVTRIEKGQDNIDNDAACILRLDFLDREGVSEKIYFDHDMRVFKRLVQLDEPYIFNDATLEQVLKEFPDRAQEILLSIKSIGQNKI